MRFFSFVALAAVFCASVPACNTAQLTDSRTSLDGGGGEGEDAGAEEDGSVVVNDAGEVIGPDGGPIFPFTKAVRVIVEPSDSGAAMRAAIANAKTSVHMTMYLLTASNVISALIAQKNAGRDVKVILNKSFPTGTNDNQQAYDQLSAAGVQVVWAPPAFTFTHEKALVVDGAEAWIMTMNATFSAPTDNREYLVVDTDPQDVAQLEKIFQGDFTNRATLAPGKLVVSPGNAARDAIRALIRGATTSVDVEVESLSDDFVTAELNAAQDAGKTVRVVLDGNTTLTPAQQQSIAALKQHKVKVVKLSTPDVHAKAIVVDGARAFVGSQNFTTNALLQNREVGVLFDVPAEVAKVQAAINQDFAAGTAL